MVRVVAVLQFKTLNAQLTDKEFDVFISNLWRSVGREKIVSLLCRQYLKEQEEASTNQNADDEGTDPLKEMTRITSHIIRNRDSKSFPCTKPNINHMPTSLVGNIASFLNQQGYIAFSMADRKMYVDCNTPNTLQRLTLKQISDYRSISLQHYPQIKGLRFNLRQISEFKVIDGQRFGGCNRIETLNIDGHNSSVSGVDMLINDSSPCFDAITSLNLVEVSLDSDRMIQILSKFAKLTRLQMFSVEIAGELNLDLLLVCPKIKEFTFMKGDDDAQTHRMLESWRTRLDTITVTSWNLPLVKRLCFCTMGAHQIDSLLACFESVQEISWIPNLNAVPLPPLSSFTTQQIEDIVKKCIFEQSQLEYLYVSTRGYFEAICNGIHRGLYLTKTRRREQMEIALNVDVQEISNAEEFVCSISRIIQVLGISDIDQWLICADAHHGKTGQHYFDLDQMKTAFGSLVDSLTFETRILRATRTLFVVGNGTQMERHSMWWRTRQIMAGTLTTKCSQTLWVKVKGSFPL